MIHSIVRYQKWQIANLNTAELAHAVQLHTNRMQANCLDAMAAYRKAPPEGKKMALKRLEAANKAFDDYIEEQQAMFQNRGLEKYFAFKNAIIPTGETNAQGKEIYRIVPRERPIQPFDDEVDQVLAEDERMMNEAPEIEGDDEWDALDFDPDRPNDNPNRNY